MTGSKHSSRLIALVRDHTRPRVLALQSTARDGDGQGVYVSIGSRSTGGGGEGVEREGGRCGDMVDVQLFQCTPALQGQGRERNEIRCANVILARKECRRWRPDSSTAGTMHRPLGLDSLGRTLKVATVPRGCNGLVGNVYGY